MGETVDAASFSAFMLVQNLNAYRLPHSVHINAWCKNPKRIDDFSICL